MLFMENKNGLVTLPARESEKFNRLNPLNQWSISYFESAAYSLYWYNIPITEKFMEEERIQAEQKIK